jgi:membrane protein YdbS with pleckstrin-like domain
MWNNSVKNIEDLPSIEVSDYLSIERSYLVVLLVRRLLFFIIIGVIGVATLISSMASVIAVFSTLLLPLIAIGVLLVGVVLFSYQSVRHQGYLLRDKDVSHKKGWINQTFTTVPFNRIQHVEVTQGLIERWFNLASLKIYTAGGNSSDLSIPGVKKDSAERIKSYLLKQVSSITHSNEEE